MIEGVERVRQFMGISGEQVRVEFGDYPVDDDRELCDLLCERNFLFGLKVIALRECAGFFENATSAGMGILEIGTALAFEV